MDALFELRGKRGWLIAASLIALIALGLVLWTRSTSSQPVRIVGFGPTSVDHGKPFNVQPNGDSAIWVRTDKPADPQDVLMLGGRQLRTTVSGNLLTAAVPLDVISSPGPKPLLVKLDSATTGAESPAVSFVVK